MFSTHLDRVSPELRLVEREIDAAYLSNPLVSIPRANALYNLLTVADDSVFLPLSTTRFTPHQVSALVDSTINEIRYPVGWLFQASRSVGRIEYVRNPTLVSAAHDLLLLAAAYEDIAGVFTLASAGLIDLSLEGMDIRTKHRLRDDVRYEVYHRLVGRRRDNETPLSLSEIMPDLARRVKVRGGRFDFEPDSRLLGIARRMIGERLDRRFSLPAEWTFTRYSLGEFRRAWKAIYALTFLQFAARNAAMLRGCGSMGVLDTLLIRTPLELSTAIVRMTQLQPSVVAAVLEDLTYGARGLRNPDPALQPLIPIDDHSVAIVPQIFLHLNPERNLTVLLNRIPEERAVYTRLTTEKEKLLRERLMRTAAEQALRTFVGNLPGRKDLPDIDLALISDDESVVLLLELKWFVEPADPRELVEKDEEIAKGLDQAESLLTAVRADSAYRKHLGLPETARVEAAVVSENSIGHTAPIGRVVPVIQAGHLEARLASGRTLASTVDWLNSRAYLPREGEDFEIVPTHARVAGYHLEWYAYRPLTTEEYLPIDR